MQTKNDLRVQKNSLVIVIIVLALGVLGFSLGAYYGNWFVAIVCLPVIFGGLLGLVRYIEKKTGFHIMIP